MEGITAMYNTLLSHSLSPIFLFEQYMNKLEYFFDSALIALSATAGYSHSRSSFQLHEDQQALLAELMQPVKKTGRPGQYSGALMTLHRTRQAAEMSGDWNDIHVNPENPHPLFGGKLVAHGMDAVTQAFAALKLELYGTGLVPKKVDIEFQKPVFLEETMLRISITPAGVFDREREIEVFAWNEQQQKEKLAVKLRVLLKVDHSFDDWAWFRVLMSGWQISALLAKTWPSCLYYKQSLNFDQLEGNFLETHIRGEGQNDRGHCLVRTQAYGAGHQFSPFVTGQATIILPATD